MPDEESHHAAVGEVAIRHTHLDHMLRMTVKSLTGMKFDETLIDTHREGSSKLRKRLRKEARIRLDESDFERLDSLLGRCRTVTEERNKVIHNAWVMHLSEPNVGQLTALGFDHVWWPVPSVEQLRLLAVAIADIVEEVNTARLEGWLKDAINLSRDSESGC